MKIIYLSGYRGNLDTGLSEVLFSCNYEVTGWKYSGLARPFFVKQVDTLNTELVKHLWRKDSQVIGVSFVA
jgi:hypothetical protein